MHDSEDGRGDAVDSTLDRETQPTFVPAAYPANERARLDSLQRYRVLDTYAEQSYDDLAQMASLICGTPVALLSLVDENRQWFKARIGLGDVHGTPRDVSLCAHAILSPDELMEIPDALEDPRFAGNPLVQGAPKIRFYAGAPLVTPDGAAIGTICVIDRAPRTLTPEQRSGLQCLARQTVAQLELRYLVGELEREGLTDGLTGVWNRRAFDIRLGEEWTRHCRSGRVISLLMIDVDRFKRYNDTFGHPEGDWALKETARLLGKTMRGGDYLVRYGGEEFALITPETDGEGARIIAERLRQQVENGEWKAANMTVSIGVASALPMRMFDRHMLVARADHALYRAKALGRNRVEVFTSWEKVSPIEV